MRLAILISGGGTTAEAVIKAIQNNILANLLPIVISSSKDAKGNYLVKNLGITPIIIEKKLFPDNNLFGEKILQLLQEKHVDIVSLQGWLPLLSPIIVQKYKGNIINQHGAPIDPGRIDFGGYGMTNPYRFTCARLAYIWTSGDKAYTESSVHFVEEEFDKGDLIRTEKLMVPAKKGKITIEQLRKDPAELIKTTYEVVRNLRLVEHTNVIESLRLLSSGGVKGFKRKKPLIPKDKIIYVEPAKKLARELFPYKNL